MGGRFGQDPRGKALLCKSLVKALLRNTASVTPGVSVLTCVLASSQDAEHVRKYSEPESKGSCTAVRKSVCVGPQCGPGGDRGRAQGQGLEIREPPTPAHVSLLLT